MKCKCCGEEMTAGIVLHHRCLDERLRKIGFLVQDGRVLVARDENGRAMKVRETNA